MFGIHALAPTASPPRLRSQLLSGFRLALVVITAAWLAAPTTARAQTDYVLSNASAVLNACRSSPILLMELAAQWYSRPRPTIYNRRLRHNIRWEQYSAYQRREQSFPHKRRNNEQWHHCH
jgi:hypothetical protein